MIGKIKGTLSEVEGNIGLVETASGVFYEVFLTPAITASHTPGKQIEVYTYHHIREDIQILFGFMNKEEYHLFKLLLGVDGVGPKTAFGIISYSDAKSLVQAATTNDIEYFTRIPGLGKKTAMKLLLELSQKLNADFKMEKMHLSEEEKTVVDALVSLGFRTTEAKKILPNIPQDLPIEKKIAEAIKLATKPGNKN
jgi:Holliday junction DNA helicase RuvA